jgi:hypothetical protein
MVTNALNMELITVGENQYIFQNMYSEHVLDLPSFMTATRSRFIPQEYINNNIAYILGAL